MYKCILSGKLLNIEYYIKTWKQYDILFLCFQAGVCLQGNIFKIIKQIIIKTLKT